MIRQLIFVALATSCGVSASAQVPAAVGPTPSAAVAAADVQLRAFLAGLQAGATASAVDALLAASATGQ